MNGVQACVRKTHSAGASLHRATWTGVAERAAGQTTVAVPQATVVPTVNTAAEPGAFPGLYPAGLSATMIPARPWLGAAPLRPSAPGPLSFSWQFCTFFTGRLTQILVT